MCRWQPCGSAGADLPANGASLAARNRPARVRSGDRLQSPLPQPRDQVRSWHELTVQTAEGSCPGTVLHSVWPVLGRADEVDPESTLLDVKNQMVSDASIT